MRGFKRLAAALVAGGGLTIGTLAATAGTALADYGQGAAYQVEISVNPPGEGVWFWAELSPTTSATSGTGDYQETDCIHLSRFAHGQALDASAHYAGTLNWYIDSSGNLVMENIGAIGGTDPLMITVPTSAFGHSNTVTFSDLFRAISGTFSGSQVQVQLAP